MTHNQRVVARRAGLRRRGRVDRKEEEGGEEEEEEEW
jgi:hypothetical protein